MEINKELNHSASHVLAMAVLALFPNTKLGFGPATNEGFYYDFEFEKPLLETDLLKIEKQMRKIVSMGLKMEKAPDDYAYDFSNQPYKKELEQELKQKKAAITYYALVDKNNKNYFVDLCRGGHIETINKIKNFKLLSLAGAYWRGNSDNIQLTRIYGTAWNTKDELNQFLAILEERKERDHRKIGKQLEIFTFDQLSGQGFPIWLESGMRIKNRIMNKILYLDRKYGFKEVLTPIVGEKKLYEISGHWDHYQEDMFKPIKVDNENLVLRPMTCPHHILIYKQKRKSYKEFPIRISEQSNLFRYEKSGALTGMERVRSMMLTEGHIFVREDQIIDEFKHCYKLIQEALLIFNIGIDYVSLSLRDKNDKSKYFDDDKMWEKAESDLKKVLAELGIKYVEKIGEAAFYGPKIDIQIKTVLGHEITLSTLQLDFLLPKRFDLNYIDKEENLKTPIMIHRGLIGTYERFISILLEQTKGDIDFWLAPKQICIIPINNDQHLSYANNLYQKLFTRDYFVELDSRNERINKKIREAQMSKVKIQIVIGDEEVNTKTLSLRFYGKSDIIKIHEDKLLDYLEELKNGN